MEGTAVLALPHASCLLLPGQHIAFVLYQRTKLTAFHNFIHTGRPVGLAFELFRRNTEV